LENALLVGLSRQIALGRELDIVANNLANINTTGYKTDGSVFEEYLMPVASADDFPSADRRVSFVQDRTAWHNFTQGPIQRTGSPLDVAVDGNAFLVVQTAPDRVTRATARCRSAPRAHWSQAPAIPFSARRDRSSSSRPTTTSRSTRTAASRCAKAPPRPPTPRAARSSS
jgi:hypothetical protein